jgi:cation transport regulator ChaB
MSENDPQLDELQNKLQKNFPKLAQRLYVATYHLVLSRLDGDEEHEVRLTVAHEAALFAVERQFLQDDDGDWYFSPVYSDSKFDSLGGAGPGPRK